MNNILFKYISTNLHKEVLISGFYSTMSVDIAAVVIPEVIYENTFVDCKVVARNNHILSSDNVRIYLDDDIRFDSRPSTIMIFKLEWEDF